MRLITTFLLLIIAVIGVGAQDLPQEYLDTLEYEALLELFDEYHKDSINEEKIARTYLNRARKEKDTIKMARGYDRLARIFHPKKNIAFADSIILLTNNIEHVTYPALAYMIKGYEFNKSGDLINSTKNIYTLYEYSLKNKNLAHQLYALQFLIKSKSFWGDQQGALELQKQRHELVLSKNLHQKLRESSRKDYQEIDDLVKINQIVSMYGFVYCYLNLGEYEMANSYIDSLQVLTNQYDGFDYMRYKIWTQQSLLELNYNTKNYSEALSIGLKLINDQSKFNYSYSYFDNFSFTGYTLMALGREEEGIKLLIKADSVFQTSKTSILPYKRRVFVELLEFYRKEESEVKQIEYLNKLLEVDSVLKLNFQYFEPEQIKKFDTPRLVGDKENLIQKLEQQNKHVVVSRTWILAILIGCLLLLLYYINRQIKYKRRFNALSEKMRQEENHMQTPEKRKNEIDAEVVEDIMKKLKKFELDKGFLQPDLSLQGLAKMFHTNSNYLSRVINLQMEKNYSTYIHDLRLDYSVNELLTQPLYRQYTIKAIAEECGYTNAESFSRAFFKKNGIYPSYYIKKLIKKNQ